MDDVKFLGVFFEILVVVRCSEQVSSQPKEGIGEADKDVRMQGACAASKSGSTMTYLGCWPLPKIINLFYQSIDYIKIAEVTKMNEGR